MLINDRFVIIESMQPVLLTQKESTKTGHFDSKAVEEGKRMKKIIFCVLVMVSAVLLAGCGPKKPAAPDADSLKSMVPDELLHYNIYDFVRFELTPDRPMEEFTQEVTSAVKSLRIIRRQTNEKNDYVECELVLSDVYLERTMTMAMFLNYYDEGGWFLDSWNLLTIDLPSANQPYDLNALKRALATHGYQPIEDITVETEKSSLHYVGKLTSGSYPYLRVSGQVDAVVSLQEASGGYSWNLSYDPQLSMEWNIAGNWYGEPHSFSYSIWDGLTVWPGHDYLYVNIFGVDGETISGTIEDKWDADGGGIGTYEQQTNMNVKYSVEKLGTGVQDIRLIVTFNAGYHDFDLAFGPESAYIRFHYHANMPDELFGGEWVELQQTGDREQR